MANNVHTVHNQFGWQNKVENKPRPLGTYSNKGQAQEAGRIIAKKLKVEHVIHGLNGKIQNKNSYGNDPCPPKDKK